MKVNELLKAKEQDKDLVLVDIREPFEKQLCNIEGTINIPMRDITSNMHKLPRNKNLVIICHKGIRSKMVIDQLNSTGYFKKVHNLEGGIDQWAIEIDREMTRY